jgi:hypothetical protein
MSQNFCFVCFGTSLVVSDGLIICNDCGTQSQVRPGALRVPAAARPRSRLRELAPPLVPSRPG